MVHKKAKSKRQTLKQKYKIQKKVRDHKKKVRKEARDKPVLKSRKDPGIPNSWPFKEELLQELENAKAKMEERKQMAKERRRSELEKRRAGGLEELMQQAQQQQQVFDEHKQQLDGSDGEDEEGRNAQLGQQSRRAYLRDLNHVIERADVICQVLDARDPLGSRSRTVEEAVSQRGNKRLVIILNKCDLVPKENLVMWLAVMRREYPTVAFKAATQSKGALIGQTSGDVIGAADGALESSSSVGADTLLQLLKNYCRSFDIKTSITVGVVGYPNVGKSSLINSLKRTRAVGVSSTAGFTKTVQEVHLDKNIRLLDCPGVVMADGDSASVALRNCIDPDQIPDPIGAVEGVLHRCPREDLMQLYEIPAFEEGNVDQFLALVGRRLGKLKRGGIVNKEAAAVAVLRDWNGGKVKYCTVPPPELLNPENQSLEEIETRLMDGFSEEFDFQAADIRVLQDARDDSTGYIVLSSSVSQDATEAPMDMQSSEPRRSAATSAKAKKTKKTAAAATPRSTRATRSASNAGEQEMNIGPGEDYDFDADFH